MRLISLWGILICKLMERSITSILSSKTSKNLVLIVFLSCMLALRGIAQTDTEFWFAAPEIDSTHADSSILRFASIKATTVTISIPKNPGFTPVQIIMGANSSAILDWNRLLAPNIRNAKNLIENTALDVPAKKGILITSTEPIEASYEVRT